MNYITIFQQKLNFIKFDIDNVLNFKINKNNVGSKNVHIFFCVFEFVPYIFVINNHNVLLYRMQLTFLFSPIKYVFLPINIWNRLRRAL